MMDGWQAVTAIVGVAAVIGSTWVSIYRHNTQAPKEPVEASMEVRITKLEGGLEHAVQGQERLEKEQADKRKRFEDVVDGIYKAIDDVRKEVFELVKRRA